MHNLFFNLLMIIPTLQKEYIYYYSSMLISYHTIIHTHTHTHTYLRINIFNDKT